MLINENSFWKLGFASILTQLHHLPWWYANKEKIL